MIEILRKRRSVRKYDDKSIGADLEALLKEALLRSPSSKNNKPWEFIFVNDSEVLSGLARSKPHGAKFIERAPLAIVILGDEEKSDVWIEDCAIAAITIQYVAESLDLGSCWVQVRERNFDDTESAEHYVQKLLNIPSNYRVASIVALGHPQKRKDGVPYSDLDFSKIRDNRF